MTEDEISFGDKAFPPEREIWDKGKLAVFAVFAVYFLDIVARQGNNWCLLDGINLWIHEAGHLLFMVFGSDFLTIAGGTLMQLIMPLVFVAYFIYTEQKFSAALTLFWVGESLANVAVYLGDAVDMALPLIGGGGPESHDWHNMLSMLGLLSSTPILAQGAHLLAILIVLVAIGWGISCCRSEETFSDRFSSPIS